MTDPSTTRRLAFIKYLYGIAIQQSKAPELLAAASLLTFHDSVELFLQLASEHLNSGSAHPGFMDYWPLISAKLPAGAELSQQESMRRLNKARVALKHHGTLPAKLDIEAFRTSTTAFFLDNTSNIFSLNFNEISLTDFVRPEIAQARLKEAEQHLANDKLVEALGEIAIAFEEVLDDYEVRKRGDFGQSPFFFGRDLSFHDSFFMGLDRDEGNHKLSEFVDRVRESIGAMQTAIKMLALGVDYRRYSRFTMYVPIVRKRLNGGYHIQSKWNKSELGPTNEDVQYCIDFVVETAIHFREFDYDVPRS